MLLMADYFHIMLWCTEDWTLVYELLFATECLGPTPEGTQRPKTSVTEL